MLATLSIKLGSRVTGSNVSHYGRKDPGMSNICSVDAIGITGGFPCNDGLRPIESGVTQRTFHRVRLGKWAGLQCSNHLITASN